jgi:hypothetical protein
MPKTRVGVNSSFGKLETLDGTPSTDTGYVELDDVEFVVR